MEVSKFEEEPELIYKIFEKINEKDKNDDIKKNYLSISEIEQSKKF